MYIHQYMSQILRLSPRVFPDYRFVYYFTKQINALAKFVIVYM